MKCAIQLKRSHMSHLQLPFFFKNDPRRVIGAL